MTLSQYIDDVLLEARNNQITESEKLSRHQISLWIKTYRAYLMKLEIDKNDELLDDAFTLTLILHLKLIEEEPGHYEYISEETLPMLMSARGKPAILSVKDMFGNVILLGSETKMKYLRFRKYTCDHYIAYVKDSKLYVEGDSNVLETIEVKIIAEDPTEMKCCYNPDTDEYPIPAYMWGTIKSLIFSKDIPIMMQAISDVTNNTEDNTLNRYLTK